MQQELSFKGRNILKGVTYSIYSCTDEYPNVVDAMQHICESSTVCQVGT